MPHTPTLAIVLTIIGGVVLAGMDATAKYMGQLGVPVLIVLWSRYFFHTVLTFIGFGLMTRSLSFLRTNSPKRQFYRAAALFGATTSFYIALTKMPLGDAASIQFLAPVLVTAISGLFLRERVGPRRWVAVVLAFVGVLIVTRPGSGVFGVWALLPLLTAVLLALYMILTRTIGPHDSLETTTFYTTFVGAIALSGVMPFVWTAQTIIDWPLMIFMGVLGAAGHLFWVQAFRRAEASALAPFTYSQVVAAIALSAFVFGDKPSAWTLIGTTLIVGSGLFVWYRERQAALRAQHDLSA